VSKPAKRRRVPARRGSSSELVKTFLARRKERTRQTYEESLRDFARYLGHVDDEGKPDVQLAAAELLSQPDAPAANMLVLNYQRDMQTRPRPNGSRGLAANTCNQRLYTLRALTKLARLSGYIAWTLEVEADEAVLYRDTRGPGRAGFVAMLELAAKHPNEVLRARDVAILRLGYDLALRRSEIVSLDYPAHLDLETGQIQVLGKKRTAREPLTAPGPTRLALAAWVEVRGSGPGPLFLSLDRAAKGDGRLSGRGVALIVGRLSAALGLKASPHGLRHAAITDALDAGASPRAVQRFARWRDARTVNRYDDNREDLGGQVAEVVAARVSDPEFEPEDLP